MVRAMGGEGEQPRPIWRTPLALVLLAWIVAVLGATLAAGRLMEMIPPPVLVWAAIGLYLAPIPPLLAWGVWAMLREPMTGWMAPTLLMAFCGGFVPAAKPLFDAGVDLNFIARRPTYDAIVQDARAPPPRVGGRVEGERDGVRFRYIVERPGEIAFIWADGEAGAGIRYDDTPCVATRTTRCVDRGRRLTREYSFYQRIF